MKKLTLLVGLLVLVWAGLSLGATSSNWTTNCGGVVANDSIIFAAGSAVSPGQTICFALAAAAEGDESPIIYTGRCENLDLFWFGDGNEHTAGAAGDGTAATSSTMQPQTCPHPNILTDGERDNACENIEGVDTPIAINNGVNGAPGVQFFRVISAGGSAVEEGLFQLKCAQPSESQ